MPAHAVRKLGIDLRVLRERCGCILWMVQRDSDPHLWSEAMSLELELGHGAEVPASSMQCPEEIGVLGFAGPDDFAGGGHELERLEVVARQAVLAGEPADASPERQAPQARFRDDAGRDDQAILRARGGDVAQPTDSLDPHQFVAAVYLKPAPRPH